MKYHSQAGLPAEAESHAQAGRVSPANPLRFQYLAPSTGAVLGLFPKPSPPVPHPIGARMISLEQEGGGHLQ